LIGALEEAPNVNGVDELPKVGAVPEEGALKLKLKVEVEGGAVETAGGEVTGGAGCDGKADEPPNKEVFALPNAGADEGAAG